MTSLNNNLTTIFAEIYATLSSKARQVIFKNAC
jgi:hypothetical protein